MSAESYHHHDDLHRLVDQLDGEQADEARSFMLRLVTRPDEPAAEQPRRRFSFVGTLSAEPDFAERSEDILGEIVRRNAG